MSKTKQLEKQLKEERAKEIHVEFYSPGTFVSETSSVKVKSKDLKVAAVQAKKITERYNSKPYGFRFTDGNSKSLSGLYYLTGKIIRYDDISDSDEKLSILKSNMRCNNWPFVVENTNSWRFTGQFEKEDRIVDFKGNILAEGDAPDLMEYRKKFEKFRNNFYAKV